MNRTRVIALLMLSLAGCPDPVIEGPGLNVVVHSTSLDTGARSRIAAAKLTVSGDISPYTRSIDVVAQLRNGEANFRYLPETRGGNLTVRLDVSDAADALIASATSAPVSFTEGQAVRVELELGASAQSDLGSPPDLMPLKMLGQSCGGDSECQTGFCAGGTCCGSACPASDVSTCGNTGKCDPSGQCIKWAHGSECAQARCDTTTNADTAAGTCDGVGHCIMQPAVSCGTYLCRDATQCATACSGSGSDQCTAGNWCVGGVCKPPTCSDGVKNGAESGVDCGGASGCPRCDGNETCTVAGDCLSATCTTGKCTAPTYAWRTTAFSACNATACSLGTQSRSVTCVRNDNTVVVDGFCGGARPVDTQSCTNTAGCSWATGAFGTCSVRCGGGVSTRAVYCQNTVGGQVPSNWCASTPPATTQSCNTHPCKVYVAALNATGPCWGNPATCRGGYPEYPNCPPGYAPTRSEQACGNPNNCGGNWALCTFLQVHGYGCLDANFVMGVSSRECTWQ